MLNNLLTALYCQWDLSFPEECENPDESVAALKRTVDLVAREIRNLSRSCADFTPAAEAVRRRDQEG